MIKFRNILLAAVGAASIGGAAHAQTAPTIPADQGVR